MKKYIVGFILGAILFTGVGVLASQIFARDIKYNNTNVESALNDLYTRTSSGIFNKFVLKTRTESWSSTDAGVSNYNLPDSSIPTNYDYFKITDITTSNIKSYEINGFSKQLNKNVSIQLNTEYNLSNISNIWVVVYSNTTGTVGYAIPTVEFYNK